MLIRVPISQAQYDGFKRPVGATQKGGFQRLIFDLQSRTRWLPQGAYVEMTRVEMERVVAYSDPKYGSGTYQSQLRAILPAVQAILAYLPVREVTGSLFGEADA